MPTLQPPQSPAQPSPAPPPAPPAPPSVPGAPSVAPVAGAPIGISVPGVGTIIPMTQDQLDALDGRREQLSDQLESAQSRRDRTSRDLEDATSPADRAGLEERLRFLDERILSVEREIAENSQLRASLEATLPRASSRNDDDARPSNDSSGPPDGIIALLVLFPISLAIARNIWRRTTRRTVVTAAADQDARFVQLEQAIDSVAVEIERVAEGQRFVTKLLREGQPIPDFSAGRVANPVGSRSTVEGSR